MIIAVDFDGTIVPDIFFPDKVPDQFMPGAKEALVKIHDAGHRLILWTLRDDGLAYFRDMPCMHARSEKLKIALSFLERNGLNFFELPHRTFGFPASLWKIPADLYIEDKIPGGFPGWDAVLVHLGLEPSPGAERSPEPEDTCQQSLHPATAPAVTPNNVPQADVSFLCGPAVKFCVTGCLSCAFFSPKNVFKG